MSFPPKLMKNNYHTHMYLCRHANGSVKEYVEEAIRMGFASLGMSDHAPFRELMDRSVRMDPEDLETYLKECDDAIENYKNEIIVYKALEIEYFPQYHSLYEQYLDQLDYLALGQHYIPDADSFRGLRSCYRLLTQEHVRVYVDTLVKAMETKYFQFICHPDLMLYNFLSLDQTIMNECERLIVEAVKNKIPLEINVNGIRKGKRLTKSGIRYLYPRLEFWQLVKKHKPKVIISSDAHDPSQVYDQAVVEAYEFARQLGIEVEEAIDIRKHRRK
ncbi:MAG: histidinol-phosphatase [Candidatus Izemoplasmatales bacterium]